MRSKRTKQFHKLFARLPLHIQQEAIEAYQRFRVDPQGPIYSVRIGRSYRAVGWYESFVIRWYWIGSYEDYNNL